MVGSLRRRLNLVGAGLAAGALDFVLLSKVWSAAPPPASAVHALPVALDPLVPPPVAREGRFGGDMDAARKRANFIIPRVNH